MGTLFQELLAEFPAGVLLVFVVIGVPVILYLRQLKIRRNAKKEKEEVPEW